MVIPPLETVSLMAQISDLTEILSESSEKIFLINGENFEINNNDNINKIIISKNYGNEKSPVYTLFKFILLNIKISYAIISRIKKIDIIIFYNTNYIIILLLSKVLRKKNIVMILGDLENCGNLWYNNSLFGLGSKLYSFYHRVTKGLFFKISDKIVIEYNLECNEIIKIKNKISIAPIRFIKKDFFTGYCDNEYFNICFIGRLSYEKGIINLIEAIPTLLDHFKFVRLFIIGEGPLMDLTKNKIIELGIEKNVEVVGWIKSNEISSWLKKMNLLVIPSYTEGLPGVLLESMASNTIVLANNVGGIGQIIQDELNGFLMKNNLPNTISENIIRVLEYPEKKKILQNANYLVKETYGFKNVSEIWGSIIDDI